MADRLTESKWMVGCEYGCKGKCVSGATACCTLGAAVKRLAAYEDTGLEPKEISNLFNNALELKLKNAQLESDLSAYRALGTVEELQRLVADKSKVGTWPVTANSTFCGARIVGIDFEDGTVTLRWTPKAAGAADISYDAYLADAKQSGVVDPYTRDEWRRFEAKLTREEADAALKKEGTNGQTYF